MYEVKGNAYASENMVFSPVELPELHFEPHEMVSKGNGMFVFTPELDVFTVDGRDVSKAILFVPKDNVKFID